MNEQPAVVASARAARAIHVALKESLKTRAPYDREVDFQRKDLRRRYLNLLLVHPYAQESKEVETHLWMQTSYAFISSYKHHIVALERAIQNNPRAQQQPGQAPQKRPEHGPVEYRKLIQRFRQFLAEEERFWTLLLLRLYRTFSLTEAKPALVALGLLNETGGPVTNGGGSNSGRNHFQFPPEEPSSSFTPTTDADREIRLSIFSKAMVCLGDIARYRELYNESNGRPKAGQEDGPPGRWGRHRRGGGLWTESMARPRNYEKAQQCYELARSLVPHEGNPSHQLAILASYQNDSFLSIMHYYRSLCVRQPYDTADENLRVLLSKALDQWRARAKRDRDGNDSPDAQSTVPRVRIQQFKEKVALLHALWRVGMEKGIEKMNAISRKCDRAVHDEFFALTSERVLATDMISHTIVLAQAALWKHRMLGDGLPTRAMRSAYSPASTRTIIEWRILDHIFDVHRALLAVGKDQLGVPPPLDAVEGDLAQKITATFRRTLPALRIASKWLRANFKYLMQDQEFSAFQEREKLKDVQHNKYGTLTISAYSVCTLRFWKAYVDFLEPLSRAFPQDKLPRLAAPLEEDIDMRGFLPLKDLMGTVRSANGDTSSMSPPQSPEQVHPNVEQLMRISDLLNDGRLLAEIEESPIRYLGDRIIFNESVVEKLPPSPRHSARNSEKGGDATIPTCEESLPPAPIRDKKPAAVSALVEEDDNATVLTSQTDDQVVRDAFQFLYDDEVVYPRNNTITSENVAPKSLLPSTTPENSPFVAKAITTSSPSLHHRMTPPCAAASADTPVAPITAQDLLNDVLGSSRPPSLSGQIPQADSTAPQPLFLFGSELTHKLGQSIWSAARDEQPLRYTTSGGAPGSNIYQSPRLSTDPSYPLPQEASLSHWPLYAQNSQNSHVDAIGTPQSAPLAPPQQQQQQQTVVGHHRQVLSSSMAAPQLFPFDQVQHDAFGYGSGVPHQAPRRQDAPLGPASPSQARQSMSYGGRGIYGDPPAPSYSSSHLSKPDPRMGLTYKTSSISHPWGNGG